MLAENDQWCVCDVCEILLVVLSLFSHGEQLDIIRTVFLCLFAGVEARRRVEDESGG